MGGMRYLGNGRDHQRVDAGLGVVDFLFDETRVHDVVDAIDCQRRFGDVCGDHDLMTESRDEIGKNSVRRI